MDDDRAEPDDAPAEEDLVRRLLQSAGPRPPLPADDLAAIQSAARAAWKQQIGLPADLAERRIRRRAAWLLAASLAAALALVLGVAWWWAGRARPMPAPELVARAEGVTGAVDVATSGGPSHRLVAGEQVAAGATLSTGDGAEPGRASLRLATGATLRLDNGSRLLVASASAVELSAGAVYADTGEPAGAVSSTSTRLEVRTPAGTAHDVGTRFAVRLVGAGGAPSVGVRVRSGTVAVEHGGRSDRAEAGEELVVLADGTTKRQAVSIHGSEWEWVMEAGVGFAIEGRTLPEFLDWVSGETGWTIRYADEALAAEARGITLHGGIGRLRADRAPFVVLPGAGLTGELRGGTLVVRR